VQDDVRAVLATERAEVVARIAELRRELDQLIQASVGANADDEHDPEGATIAFERSQIAALARQARQQLVEVESALSRIQAATYGLCETCGRPIAQDRLEARPAARACIPCAT
jgi:RNA polymerase-binding transcription factor